MAKRIKKKRKIRIVKVLIALLIVYIIYFLISSFLNMKIKNIVILDNKLLSDQEIIEVANIADYPSFYWTSSRSVKRRLVANPYIKDVIVKKKFFNVLEIKVIEEKILFKKETDKKIVLASGREYLLDDNIVGIPSLVNYVPDTKYTKLIKYMSRVENHILSMISEITYEPNEFDKDRFLLYMNDGNSVYLTLTKFDMINYYNEVLPQLEGRKGILYLDSGNHFQIME